MVVAYITSIVRGEILFLSCSLVFSSHSNIACKQLEQLDTLCCPGTWVRHLCGVYTDKGGIPTDYRRAQYGETVMYVKKHQKKRTWYDAVRVCECEGASVATVGTREKVHLAEHLFRTDPKVPVEMWLGLRDVFQNGSYYWTNGSALPSSEAWRPGTRDDEKTRWEEDCVTIVIFPSMYYEWLDRDCVYRRRYLCEITPSKGNRNFRF